MFFLGFTILTAGVFQPVMYFWNVVLSYVRNQKSRNDPKINSNDIELGEHLAPNPSHAVIYKQRSNVASKGEQKSKKVKAPKTNQRTDNVRMPQHHTARTHKPSHLREHQCATNLSNEL